MPLAQFREEAYAGLAAGKEQISVGMAKIAFEEFERKRQEVFQVLIKRTRGGS